MALVDLGLHGGSKECQPVLRIANAFYALDGLS